MITAQGVFNVLLAAWLYVEYANNLFMREYLSQFWAANSSALLAVMAAGVIAAGSITALVKRGQITLGLASKLQTAVQSPSELASLDVCHFCNVPLRAVSENRFQCRNCKRYFKK